MASYPQSSLGAYTDLPDPPESCPHPRVGFSHQKGLGSWLLVGEEVHEPGFASDSVLLQLFFALEAHCVFFPS